jgi:hypothetical protein
MKPDERAFEDHIARSLVESGGYRAVEVDNCSTTLSHDIVYIKA